MHMRMLLALDNMSCPEPMLMLPYQNALHAMPQPRKGAAHHPTIPAPTKSNGLSHLDSFIRCDMIRLYEYRKNSFPTLNAKYYERLMLRRSHSSFT